MKNMINEYYTSEDDLPLIMTFAEVQEALMVSRHTLMRLLNSGKLHGFKVGRQWRIYKEEFLKFTESI